MNVLPFNVRNVAYLNKKDTRAYTIYAMHSNSVLLTLEITENGYDVYYNGRRCEDFHSFQLAAYIIELIRKVAGNTHVLIEYLPESWSLGSQRVKILGVSNLTFSVFRREIWAELRPSYTMKPILGYATLETFNLLYSPKQTKPYIAIETSQEASPFSELNLLVIGVQKSFKCRYLAKQDAAMVYEEAQKYHTKCSFVRNRNHRYKLVCEIVCFLYELLDLDDKPDKFREVRKIVKIAVQNKNSYNVVLFT